MLVIGTMIELFSFLWRRSGFRAAGRWMILIGALATSPAITTGMYAARQAMGGDDDASWTQLKQTTPFTAEQWQNLTWHTRCNVAGTIVCALLIVTWIGSSDYWRGKLHLIFMLFLLLAVGTFSYGAWNGGEMVYTHRMGSQLVKGGWQSTPADTGTTDSTAVKAGSITARNSTTEESPAPNPEEKGKEVFKAFNAAGAQMTKFDNVLDIHAMLAGWTVALALVTLGLSIRAISTSPRVPIDDSMAHDEDILQALSPQPNMPTRNVLLETGDLPTDDSLPVRVPSARFWLLTALLCICTALVGWMSVSPDSFNSAWQTLQNSHRDLAHGIAGVSIVVLALILALITRFAPTNKILIGCFALLLVAAMAIQFWFAFLLMFDGSGGLWNHMN